MTTTSPRCDEQLLRPTNDRLNSVFPTSSSSSTLKNSPSPTAAPRLRLVPSIDVSLNQTLSEDSVVPAPLPRRFYSNVADAAIAQSDVPHQSQQTSMPYYLATAAVTTSSNTSNALTDDLNVTLDFSSPRCRTSTMTTELSHLKVTDDSSASSRNMVSFFSLIFIIDIILKQFFTVDITT